jgi:hypothetical protein
VVNLPQETEELTWREAIWRFLAHMFVDSRLGRDPQRPPRRGSVSLAADVEPATATLDAQ